MRFLAQEFVAFHERLASLYKSLCGDAEFDTLERWLSIRVHGDGRGHMEFKGIIRDAIVSPNTLTFGFITDQTFVAAAVAELAQIVRTYPVVGDSNG